MNAPVPKTIPFQTEGPQPLMRALPESAPYPIASLGPLRAAVEAVQAMSLAPMALPAQSALSVASLVVQGFADVEGPGGAPCPLSLYAMTVARSGERKSSCDKPFLAPIQAYEKDEQPTHRDDLRRHDDAMTLWKAERERIVATAKNAKTDEAKAAARADLDALGGEPAPPSAPERIVSEPTFEGLTRLYVEGSPALGLFSDEGGQFLGGHAMSADNRTKSLAALNKLWDGAPIRRTRAGEGNKVLYGRRLALHLMVQPSVAAEFMGDPRTIDTGFLPRCLLTAPSSTIGTRLSRHSRTDRGPIDAFATRARALLSRPLPIDPVTGGLEPRTLRLSDGARRMLTEYVDAVEMPQAPGGDLAHITGWASKSPEQAARIAGVLTLWADLDAPEVSEATMADAITLAQFYLSEAARLADAATISAETARAEVLRRWLADWHHDEVTVRDVVQHGPNALRETKVARPVCQMLAASGWLIPLPPGTVIRGAARKEAWGIVRGADDVV